jgi:hypothetical protein
MPLSHEDLLLSRGSFFHYTELATRREYSVTDESHCTLCANVKKLTFAKHASVLYEPGATNSRLFFSSGPKNALSLSHFVKYDQQQQTQKK